MQGTLTHRQGRGSSTFHGFSHQRVVHTLSEADLAAKPLPGLRIFEDVLLLPQYEALYTPEGVRIEETKATYVDPALPGAETLREKFRRFEETKCPPRIDVPKRALPLHNATVIHVGKLFSHYGHFLTDCMSRMWALPKYDPAFKITTASVRWDLWDHEHTRRILEVLGIDQERLLLPRKAIRLKRVVCPLPAMQLSRQGFLDFDLPHRTVATELLTEARKDRVRRPVYLTRTGLGQASRVRREEELEARLAKEGFDIIHPERLPLPDQIRLFNHRSAVVGVTGSAMHTALFRIRDKPLPMALVNTDFVHGRYLLQDAIKPLDTHYLNSLKGPSAEDLQNKPQAEHVSIINVDRTMDLLDAAGFLTTAKPAD